MVKDIKVGDIVKNRIDGKLAIVTKIRDNLECPTKNNPLVVWERLAELRWLDEDRHRRLGPVSTMPLAHLEVMSRKTRDDEDDS